MNATWRIALACLALTAGTVARGQQGVLLLGGADGSAEAKAEAAGGGYWIGVEAVPPEPALRAQLGLNKGEGLLVRSVVADSPAAKAGVKEFDVLVQAGDKRLNDIGDLTEVVQAAKDQELELRLIRGGKPHTLKVTPSARPAAGTFDIRHPKPPGQEGDVIMRWFKELIPGEGGGPRALWFPQPGVVLPPGLEVFAARLPDDMSITITKKGNEPAKITVTQGDQTWEASEDQLDKLPEKVRDQVAAYLPRVALGVRHEARAAGKDADRQEKRDGGAAGIRPWVQRFELPWDAPSQQRLEKQLQEFNERVRKEMDQVQKRIDEARKQMEELEKRLPGGKPAAEKTPL